jgi:hypothetical protein
MSKPPANGPTERFTAVLVRQYTVGPFSVMNSGAGNPGPPVVAVDLESTGVVVTDLPGTTSTQWIGDGRRIWYQEIRAAQVVRNSRVYLARAPSPHEIPFGVRLFLGESRSHVLLFTLGYEALMDALESHHVVVDRTPRKLGFMLMGRK